MTRMTEPGESTGAAVRLTATLPKPERNGLARAATELVKNPRELRLLVAVADVARIIDDLDSGTDTAVVRLLRIELLDDAAKAPKAWQALLEAARMDVAQDALDFDGGEEL